ncbi:conserved hypothetical protein [Coccidioides posadasii str. Silveira]|uniref:Uncharacterized protein n=3 Tax=Coccidioides posadasii TaxID=199306 RepID=E9CZK7_COCPS|nr:conserved hypothetical protein [Coccidioides posadasii str. Silveira]KMM73323.1 hypothetical protein CPAG_09612 [Coccidioides posadasii RMSCC 3488]
MWVSHSGAGWTSHVVWLVLKNELNLVGTQELCYYALNSELRLVFFRVVHVKREGTLPMPSADHGLRRSWFNKAAERVSRQLLFDSVNLCQSWEVVFQPKDANLPTTETGTLS